MLEVRPGMNAWWYSSSNPIAAVISTIQAAGKRPAPSRRHIARAPYTQRWASLSQGDGNKFPAPGKRPSTINPNTMAAAIINGTALSVLLKARRTQYAFWPLKTTHTVLTMMYKSSRSDQLRR